MKSILNKLVVVVLSESILGILFGITIALFSISQAKKYDETLDREGVWRAVGFELIYNKTYLSRITSDCSNYIYLIEHRKEGESSQMSTPKSLLDNGLDLIYHKALLDLSQENREAIVGYYSSIRATNNAIQILNRNASQAMLVNGELRFYAALKASNISVRYQAIETQKFSQQAEGYVAALIDKSVAERERLEILQKRMLWIFGFVLFFAILFRISKMSDDKPMNKTNVCHPHSATTKRKTSDPMD